MGSQDLVNPNTAYGICTNEKCPWNGMRRYIVYPMVGNRMYAKVPIYCFCGGPIQEVRPDERQASREISLDP